MAYSSSAPNTSRKHAPRYTSRDFMYEIFGRELRQMKITDYYHYIIIYIGTCHLLTELMRVTMVSTVVTPSPVLAGAELRSR